MDNGQKILLSFYLLLLAGVYYLWRRERFGTRRYWRHPSLVWEEGEYNTLFRDYKANAHDKFFRYSRMEVHQFDELLRLVGPRLKKRSWRKPVSPEERLAMTLRFLAHGGDLVTLSESYRRGLSTTQKIVKETCDVIWEVLYPHYVNVPDADGWKKIAEGFWTEWNFPNCIGALDGKHVDCVCPPNAGSMAYNHHERHSLVLMAMCDSKYRFTYVDIGSYGSQNDSAIFTNSVFGQALLSGQLNLPEEAPLPHRQAPRYPYWIVADQAFPLSQNILRPYPGKMLSEMQKIFNYRLSRARRCIENAFGILVARWRILRSRIQAHPHTLESYVKACIALHNYVMITNERGTSQYCPANYVDREDRDTGTVVAGQWRAEARPDDGNPLFLDVGRLGANNATQAVQRMRDSVAMFLTSLQGQVEWQLRMVYRGFRCELLLILFKLYLNLKIPTIVGVLYVLTELFWRCGLYIQDTFSLIVLNAITADCVIGLT